MNRAVLNGTVMNRALNNRTLNNRVVQMLKPQSRNSRHRASSLLALLLVVSLTACGTGMRRVEHALEGEKEHEANINKVVDKFHRALYWGDADLATSYVIPEIRTDFQFQTAKRKETEKVIEAEVRKIELTEGQTGATVDVFIKYYKIPHYVVKTRHEKQEWEFNKEEGLWLFRDASVEQVL